MSVNTVPPASSSRYSRAQGRVQISADGISHHGSSSEEPFGPSKKSPWKNALDFGEDVVRTNFRQLDDFKTWKAIVLLVIILVIALLGSLVYTWQLRRQLNVKKALEAETEDAESSVEAQDAEAKPTEPALKVAAASQTEHRTLVDDETIALWAKLFGLIMVAIALTYIMNNSLLQFERDEHFGLEQFLRHDFPSVVGDTTALFVIGRVGACGTLPIDGAEFITIVLITSLLFSLLKEASFLKHSITLHELRYTWTRSTWVCAILLWTTSGTLACLHFHHFLFQCPNRKKLELLLLFALLLGFYVLPVMQSPEAHLHHWYCCWLLALVCRAPTRWSKISQAILLGGYVNGIACYGRDSVLMCQAVKERAEGLGCDLEELANCSKASVMDLS